MDLSKIEEIAAEHGVQLRNLTPRLKDFGDHLRFVADQDITYAGQRLIDFANAIEAEVLAGHKPKI